MLNIKFIALILTLSSALLSLPFHKITFNENFPRVIRTNESLPVTFSLQFPLWEVTPHRHFSLDGLVLSRPDIYRLFITLVDEKNTHLRHLYYTELFCYNGDFGYDNSDKNREGQPSKFYLPSLINSPTKNFKIKVFLKNQDIPLTSFTGYSETFTIDANDSPFDKDFTKLLDGKEGKEVSIFESSWSTSIGPKLVDVVQIKENNSLFSTQSLSFAINGTLP
ncbi:hypothetical protein HDU92_007778 [Lobulomyces angularis]|nr:hypothetical protein HDU92_007778 [Lobulomyces angularis]